MTATAATNGWGKSQLVWSSLIFIVVAHILAIAGIVHIVTDFSWWTLGLGFLWYLFSGLSITAGYHRLFSHKSYEAHALVKLFFLAFGAACAQNTALKWCADHRVHHKFADQDSDPYSVRDGFWWAHIGWVFHKGCERPHVSCSDLEADPLVQWQAKHYIEIALFVAVVIPGALGFLWDDALGAILFAGFTRLVWTWHATFSINSVTHRFGKKTYCKNESGMDSGLVALLTMGEGYHNFHHRFQTDYRNGIKWYHYDPSKWLVFLMSKIGLTKKLVRVPQKVIDNARAEVS